jgi:hypothetical protein
VSNYLDAAFCFSPYLILYEYGEVENKSQNKILAFNECYYIDR